MDVLVHLLERSGAVASKEELVASVWQGRFVTDDVLSVTIYALRKALGDDARRPRYIETVSRRGYRWIAPAPSLAPAPDPAGGHPVPSARRTVAAIAALALSAAGAAWMLTSPGRHRHVPTPEGQEAYARGRFFLDQRSVHGWQQALEQFRRAVALDPQSPAAQAGLADSYTAMSDFGVASPAEMRPRAFQAARRALEIDSESAEGYEALGRAELLFDWEFSRADRSLKRAMVLDPDYMPAYQSMAWLESARGRFSEAAAAGRRARQLDPVNTARYTELAWVLALGGRYDEALREIDRALQLNARSFETHLMKGWTRELAGRPDAAFAAYREGLRVAGAPDDALRRIDEVYRSGGLAGYYRGWLAQPRTGGSTPMSDTFRAMVLARAGEPDRALDALEEALKKHEGALAWVNVEPSFRPLHADPRFQRIAAMVHTGKTGDR